MFIQKFGGKSPSFGKDLFQEGLGPPPRVDIEKEYTNPEFKFPYIPRNKIYLERDLQAYSEAKNCLLSSSVLKLNPSEALQALQGRNWIDPSIRT